ncbi:unnamed protein product [Ambrosiozyma monospora]|uniref:Unnamed protein product n=1 Tax=Ambrosiozyma monospora TaxID=43982 RepID=A0ACB5U4B8_AMBMO|nr:unnamed protein product [Ambrosiozyma monospora]
MQDFKFLLSGHTQGVVNLTMVPTDQHSTRNAEIIKRFNHAKHIASDNTNLKMTIGDKCTNTIYKVDVTPRSWKSCNMNSLLSIYRENLFFWDTARSNLPILKNKVNGITSFDASRYQDSLLALSGEFGLSLFDMRVQNNVNMSTPLQPQTTTSPSGISEKWFHWLNFTQLRMNLFKPVYH